MLYQSRAARILRHHRGNKRPAVINLVAMIDMLTVLVFFLLVYSTEQVEVLPSKDVQLPESIAETRIEAAVVVIVSDQEILVGGKAVASIDSIMASKSSIIPGLHAELVAEAQADERLELVAHPEQLALSEAEKIAARKVTIMADRELPFKLVRDVMATSTAAGYGQLSLAVMQKASDLAFATVASRD
jgi:biopolymer transport protein TolR